ncbi:ferrichrome-iron receptor [Roseburia intestinalis]|nr:ferrichrome-iron receptor [Roseburia intestinalis]
MLFRTLPVRDIPANMQVTAKQIRYKGEDNLKNIFAVRRGSSDSGTG